MANPNILPYVIFTLEVDKDYWNSLRNNAPFFDQGSRYFNETVNKVERLLPVPTQLENANYPAFVQQVKRGIEQWLSQYQYIPALHRLYTEPKSTDKNKKRYVLAQIRSL